MGFLYCPNCSKGVSDLAQITACPDCYHPFNAKIWREEYKRKKTKEAREANKRANEREIKKAQSEAWRRAGRCPDCGGERKYSHQNNGGFTLYRCINCGSFSG